MIARLCEPEHLVIIILVLLISLLMVGAGKGGGKVLLQLLKKVLGREVVNINLEGGEMASKPKPTPCASCTITDPASCPLHQSEHERSMRNEKGIEALWQHYGDMRKEMTAGFEKVQNSISTSQQAILTALASRPRDK
jgi:hypothetical protein